MIDSTINQSAIRWGGRANYVCARRRRREIIQLNSASGPEKAAICRRRALASDLARTPDEKQMFEYVSKVISLSRVVCTNSDVPPERIAALRQAFSRTLMDAAFLAESKKLRMEIELMEGEAVQRYVNDIIDAPADLLEKIRKVIARG
jgi:hypothetical protein